MEPKIKKKRSTKVNLVFNEAKRREFLTGFHKRKLQRKKEAQEKLEQQLKEERRRLKFEAKESYKKLVASHRPIPELKYFLKDEEDDATVTIEELSVNDIAKENNWIGPNQSKYENLYEINSNNEQNNEIPGMELTVQKNKKEVKNQKFDSERDVKRLLKREATKKMKKSKVFKMKNKMEKQKQKKKSLTQKKLRIKIKLKEKKVKKRG